MDKHKNRFRHWFSLIDDDNQMKNDSKNKIKKEISRVFISLLCAVAGFSLLKIPSLSSFFKMATLMFGLSSSAVFTNSLVNATREIKSLKRQKMIDKCAEHPKVEKLNKQELELYNLMYEKEIAIAKAKNDYNDKSKYLEM